MRSPRHTVLTLLVAVAIAGWLMVPQRVHAQGAQAPDLAPLARACTDAWNARDLAAVLVCFAPDAVVRERRGAVPLEVWDSRDPQVVRTYQNAAQNDNNDNDDTGGLVWMTGHQQIGVWATARFAARHYHVLGWPITTGGTVHWPYQEFSGDQSMAGVQPLEGTAEAVVRGGRITVLTLVLSPASVARQRREVAASAGQTAAARRPSVAPIIGGGVSGQPRGLLHDGPAAPEPTTLAWPLALSGLALLAALTAGLRRRQASQPERDQHRTNRRRDAPRSSGAVAASPGLGEAVG